MAVEEFCAACGHSQKWHNDGLRKCNHMESLRPYVRCDCESFVSPEPSRRAAVSIEDYITAHPGVLDGLDGISRFLGKVDRPDDIDLWEFDCFISAIRAMLEPHDAARLRERHGEAWSAVRKLLNRYDGNTNDGIAIADGVASAAVDAVIRAIGGER